MKKKKDDLKWLDQSEPYIPFGGMGFIYKCVGFYTFWYWALHTLSNLN